MADPNLRARGLEGWFIVDASVMSTPIGDNINAPTIAIADKLVDLICGASRIHPLWMHAPQPLLNLATDVPNTRQEETRNAVV